LQRNEYNLHSISREILHRIVEIAMNSQLTKYAPGSMRELWTIARWLIISSAANMALADRVIVAEYSNAAFQALSGTITGWWTIFLTALNIALVPDLFVGPFNGSKNHRKLVRRSGK
jgi:hypothetical protein